MAIITYYVHEQDSKLRMFRDDSSLKKCPKCGYRLDFFAHNPDFVLRKSQYDVYATYDGQTIVSQAFKDFCTKENYKGLEFLEFKNDEHHYHLIISEDNIVPFDAPRRKTRFEGLCNVCGNYESIIGATPAYLKIKEPLLDGIYRSDILFASGNEKSPLFFVGIQTKEKMEEAGLRIRFSPVEGL